MPCCYCQVEVGQRHTVGCPEIAPPSPLEALLTDLQNIKDGRTDAMAKAAIQMCIDAVRTRLSGVEAPTTAQKDVAYDKVDRYLRNNLDDSDYAEYSAALETVYGG